jgi:hypothetical protein
VNKQQRQICSLLYEKLSADLVGESSDAIRKRVQATYHIQNRRFSKNGSKDVVCNADMCVGEIRQDCRVEVDGQKLMRAAIFCPSIFDENKISWVMAEALLWQYDYYYQGECLALLPILQPAIVDNLL